MKSKFNAPPKLRFLLLLVVCCFNNVFAQSKAQLYVCVNDLGPQSKSFMQANNLANIPIIYGPMVDPRRELKLDSQALTNAINRWIPDVNATGFAVIDWENKLSNDLQVKPQNSPEFLHAQAEFSKVILFAKKLRPNMKWGFFGLPFAPLDKKDTRTANINIPLLKLCDVFYTQMYVPYNSSEAGGVRTTAEKDAWVSYNLISTLKIAKAMNKPVLPFVWHRYYGGINNYTLIPLDEFNEFIKKIVALSYHGKKVDGAVMWSNDNFFYSSQKAQPVVSEFENSKSGDFGAYDDALILKYMTTINSTIDSAQ